MIFKKQKGQLSVEFIIALTLLFFILLFSFAIFSERNTDLIHSQELRESKLIANKIARTINSVALAGDGVETKLLLEKKFDYNVDFFENSVRVHFRNQFVSVPTITSNINTDSITPGGFIKISNQGGQVFIADTFTVPIVVTCANQAACFSHSWNSSVFTCVTSGNPNNRYCQLSETAPFWTIQNTSSGTIITITRIMVSWAGDTDGDLDVDVIEIDNIQRNSISSASGVWNDVTDFSLSAGQSMTTNNWLRWQGSAAASNMDNETETYTLQFEFSDASTFTTTAYNPA